MLNSDLFNATPPTGVGRPRTQRPVAPGEPKALLSTREAARFLGMSKSFLDKARFNRDPNGPAFIRIGSRSVRYERAALLAWIAARSAQGGGK